MREIKFRAYLPVGEWSEDGTNQKYEMVGPEALAFEEYEPLADLLKNCENLMQYTGLKDRTGREIYEGDILAIRSIPIGTVIMGKRAFCLEYTERVSKAHGGEKDSEVLPWNMEGEGNPYIVIGNIYETASEKGKEDGI